MPLLAENLRAAAFIVAWANALWWLPELAKATPDIEDRVRARHSPRPTRRPGARRPTAEAAEAPRTA